MKNFEDRRAISQLRLASHKLEILISKWNKMEKELRICKFCDKNQVEDELHFLLECSKYEQFRENAVRTIFEKDKLNLNNKNKTETLRDLFKNASLTSLNILGKFINEAFKERESKNAPRI